MPDDEPDDDALAAVARELYVVVPAQFVAARNARAVELRRAGQKGLAARVRALPKPAAAAWALGTVARELPEELDALGSLGAELRVAQASANPAELRELARRRRTLTARVAQAAGRHAEEQGVRLSPGALEQVEGTLQAVVLSPAVERAVRSCLLVRTVEPGVAELDGVLAVPGAVDLDDAEQQQPPAAPRPPAQAVRKGHRQQQKDDDGGPATRESPADVARAIRKATRELRARERTAERALADLEEAQEELSQVEAEVLRVAARIEELRRELAEREEELGDLDADRTAAQEERDDAEERARVAARELDEARERLAGLER